MRIILCIIMLFLTSVLYGQNNLKIELAPGKFILVKGYTLEEDTLIARSPEKEKDIAWIQNKLIQSLDENDYLKKKDTLNMESLQTLNNILARKDFVITKQDSLIIQLEKIAEPESGFVKFLKNTFDRKMMFILGFVGGVYAGISIN